MTAFAVFNLLCSRQIIGIPIGLHVVCVCLILTFALCATSKDLRTGILTSYGLLEILSFLRYVALVKAGWSFNILHPNN
jgi:hypothetical protein